MIDAGTKPSSSSSSYLVDCAQAVSKFIETDPSHSIIKLVELMLEYAQAARASDVHINPLSDSVLVRFRIDGVLEDVLQLPLLTHHEVVTRFKILCGLRTDEHQAAQDGRFRLALATGTQLDVRVSIAPVYYGENVVLRLLSAETEVFTLDKLGFSTQNQVKIMTALKKPYGMILATGPTGSGKTTTLYTLLQIVNTPGIAIVTIEDPIEYAIAGVNQIQVNPRTGLTFATGLRSMLRQDPNIIMVGEIRDHETAGLAINIALTGHLVFSTLHTNDAATTLPRLLDMKVEPYLIASTVNIAIGQRLLRRLCTHCKSSERLTALEVESLGGTITSTLLIEGAIIYRAVGCDWCNGTGYHGRIGIHEVLVVTPTVRAAVLEQKTASDLRSLAVFSGMVPLIEDGFLKVLSGDTSLEEILTMRYE